MVHLGDYVNTDWLLLAESPQINRKLLPCCLLSTSWMVVAAGSISPFCPCGFFDNMSFTPPTPFPVTHQVYTLCMYVCYVCVCVCLYL